MGKRLTCFSERLFPALSNRTETQLVVDRQARPLPVPEPAKRLAPPTLASDAVPARKVGVQAGRLKATCDGGTLCQIRNVRVGTRRTTLRLEAAFWEAFDALCAQEGVSIDTVLTDLESERNEEALTSMVRTYLIAFWRGKASPA